MHDWFAPSVSRARTDSAIARAGRHRSRVALGADLRSRATRPLIASADRACARLSLRRDVAVAAFDHGALVRGAMALAPRHA